MSTNNKWGALSMRDRAFLIREAVRNGITDIGSIRDLYNQNGERIRLGTPYRTFESGSDYDYFNAAPENIPQENDEHWSSRNPHTGQLLKSPNHPTYNLLLEGEKQAGYKVQKIGDREYSFPNAHRFDGTQDIIDGGTIPSVVITPDKQYNKYIPREHQYDGLGDIFKKALSLYNPWSARSTVAKAASPTVSEGLSDLDTAVQAYVYNDKDARKKMESDHALATASSAAAASAIMPLVLAPTVAPSVSLLTTHVPSRAAQAFSSIMGSIAAGTAVNEVSKAVTGKDFGTAAYDAVLPELWKENPYIQEYGPGVMDMLFNPGYRNGKLLETGISKGMNATDAASKYVSGVKKRTAETIMRIGDQANRLESLAKQFLDKKSLQFILNPNKSHYAYELPFRYSGQLADATKGAHKDDLIDVYLGKSKTLKGLKYGPDWEGIPSDYSYNVITLDSNDTRLPSEVRDWLKKHKKPKIQLIDFGNLHPSTNGVDLNSEYQKWISENSPSWRSGESMGISDELGYHLVDPGGYNIKPFINENGDFIMSNFDIWKYTPEEYAEKYLNNRMEGFELFLRKKGLSFLDEAGTPILSTWQYRLPKTHIPGTTP